MKINEIYTKLWNLFFRYLERSSKTGAGFLKQKFFISFLFSSFVLLTFSTGTAHTQDNFKDSLSIPKDSILISQDTLRVANKTTITADEDKFDIRFFRTINTNRTKFLDNFLDITDRSVLPLAIVLPVGMAVYARAKDRAYDENTAYLLAAGETVNFLVTGGLKFIVKKPRPFIALQNVIYRKTALIDKYSFPSGHTSMAFSIASMLTLRYPKYPQVYIPVYLWGLIVGYGRPYFGMHYPSDVLGGAVVGTLSSVFIFSIRKEIIKLKNSVFNEEGTPDENINSSSAGIIAVSYILSLALNEFLLNDKNVSIGISPFYKYNMNSVVCRINMSF